MHHSEFFQVEYDERDCSFFLLDKRTGEMLTFDTDSAFWLFQVLYHHQLDIVAKLGQKITFEPYAEIEGEE